MIALVATSTFRVACSANAARYRSYRNSHHARVGDDPVGHSASRCCSADYPAAPGGLSIRFIQLRF
jgi:hypothetical protein